MTAGISNCSSIGTFSNPWKPDTPCNRTSSPEARDSRHSIVTPKRANSVIAGPPGLTGHSDVRLLPTIIRCPLLQKRRQAFFVILRRPGGLLHVDLVFKHLLQVHRDGTVHRAL